jgi:hypothetical protein
MINTKKTAIYATLLIVAAAVITSGAIYVMANQPTTPDKTGQSIAPGEPNPNGMSGLETVPENQTDYPGGPQL